MHDQPLPGLDLWHEDGLLFDESPELFVHLERDPIVFTVRGIQYFAPRFRHIGVDIATLNTAESFLAARRRWEELELALLRECVSMKRRPGVHADPYNALQAVLDGDLEAAEAHVAALERRARSSLHLVQPRASE